MMKVAKKMAITLYNILSYTKHHEIYGADNILAIMQILCMNHTQSTAVPMYINNSCTACVHRCVS